MKCIHCEHDSKYSDRILGSCPNCKRKFAFEPKSGDRYTDMAFHRAIERVSAGGKIRWAMEHLYYELQRSKPRFLSPTKLVMSGVILFGVAGYLAFVEEKAGFIFPGIFGVVAFVAALTRWLESRRRLSRDDFTKMWTRWNEVHGKPAGLVTPASRQSAPSRALEEELSAYSFDRAVICDRRAVVDVLLANQFHFENNCAVLGVDGYPEGVFPIVMKMLRQNPKLNVFVVHDASPEGCRLAHTLRTSAKWFKEVGKVVDVGLRPAHAKFFPGLAYQYPEAGRVEPSAEISRDEAKWLSKYRLDLTVVRPEQLIKRLYRAITGVESGEWDGGSGGDSGMIYMGSDAGTSDGGGDSFG